MNETRQKRALVTGGSGDLGSAICRQLAAEGFSVLVHAGRNIAAAECVVAEIREAGGEAKSVSFDVTDAAECGRELEALLAEQTIQVLVNNAGIHSDAPLAGMSDSQWRSVIEVNLQGFFNVCKPLLMPMARTRWGRVIGISSIAARGNRGQANYAAAKAGMEAAIRSVSLEMASRGITANCVAPGVIQSSMSDAAFDKDFIRTHIPARRMGRADEVAALVAFLASDKAGYINGQTIAIDGGMR
ncbi:MAG: 3-oxoacyl-ACP reductase FabG [Xanthomonadales bacterium]|nr:3-oxoacyl-ACP reductase FabG [Xanthomonadales bacterium]